MCLTPESRLPIFDLRTVGPLQLLCTGEGEATAGSRCVCTSKSRLPNFDLRTVGPLQLLCTGEGEAAAGSRRVCTGSAAP